MTMTPAVRKFALTVHLVASIGWIGSVIAYLALDVAAVAGPDADSMRAAFMGMRLILVWVIVPLAFASLITGLIMSLGTPWGLLRHYWVLFSFILTVFALIVLVQHTPDATALADSRQMDMAGAHSSASSAAHGSATNATRVSSGDFLHAGGGLAVLLVVTVLNVYKPRGMTPYGWRLTRSRVRDRDEGAAAS